MTRPSRGYHALSSFLGPHLGIGLFRRFASLNAHSLLIQQAELLYLERQLRWVADADETSGLDHNTSVKSLLNSLATGDYDDQARLILQIRAKLDEYNHALLQQAELCRLPDPRSHDLRVLQEWLKRKDGGGSFLSDVEDMPWLESQKDDLIALTTRGFDTVTETLAEKIMPWAAAIGLIRKAPLPGHEELGLVSWQDNTYRAASRGLSVIVSTLIPSVAIVVLFIIPGIVGRIVAAMALSLAFSTALALLTTAKPSEIFAATAAFAAVQVVFIGSTSTTLR